MSEPATLKADIYHLLPIIKFELSNKNWNFRKLLSSSFPVFNDFSDETDGDINECDFSVLYSEMCQHLEGLHNSVSKNFPNEQCKILQNHVWIKDLFKMQDRTMDFNVTEYKMFITLLSDFTLQLTFRFKKYYLLRASLVAQWLRIHLPMQGTRVQALAQEAPTCHRATKPLRPNY